MSYHQNDNVVVGHGWDDKKNDFGKHPHNCGCQQCLRYAGTHLNQRPCNSKCNLHHNHYFGPVNVSSCYAHKFWLILAIVIIVALIIIGIIYLTRDSEKHCDEVYHHKPYQSYDGSGNTKDKHTGQDFGKPGEKFPRYMHSYYEDGKDEPSGKNRKSPRYISNYLCAVDDDNSDDDDNDEDDNDSNKHHNFFKGDDDDDHFSKGGNKGKGDDDDNFSKGDNKGRKGKGSKKNKNNLSSIVWLWGQLIDHTVTLGPTDHTDNLYVNITCDPIYDKYCQGSTMTISRTKYEYDEYGSRQQNNVLSSYIDGSSIYGHKPERIKKIRKYQYGQVWLSDDDYMPPINNYNLENGPDNSPNFYLFGDIRGNEHLGLTAMHTIWLREHNYWAKHYYEKYPTWNDEKIFQSARRIVIAELQSITYNEFIPSILGTKLDHNCYHSDDDDHDHFNKDHHDTHKNGYNNNDNNKKDPRIYNEFATCAFRFGHTMVNNKLHTRDIHTGHIKKKFKLLDVFFKPEHYMNKSLKVDEMILGLCKQHAEEIDLKIVNSMRNALVDGHAFDLVSFNVARGRDHGIPDYLKLRYHFGGEPVNNWYDICSDEDTVNKLTYVYGYQGWKDLDPWIGMLAEDHYPGSNLGYTMHHIIKDQFQRLKDGDAYTYLWDSDLYDKEIIHETKFKDVILRNTHIDHYLVKDDVFHV
jgi:hypothetical protein